MNKTAIITVFLFSFILTIGIAQKAVITSGSNGFGTGGSISYTVGQVAYKSISGANSSITVGLQQSSGINVLDVEDIHKPNLNVLVYPNPTTDLLVLDLRNPKQEMEFALYDTLGKRMMYDIIIEQKTGISIKGFSDATYFLIVFNGNQIIKRFQIIKTSK